MNQCQERTQTETKTKTKDKKKIEKQMHCGRCAMSETGTSLANFDEIYLQNTEFRISRSP